MKAKDKEKIKKNKENIAHKRKIQIVADFSPETLEARRQSN